MHVLNGLLDRAALKKYYFSIAKDMYPDLIEEQVFQGFIKDKPIFKYCIDRNGFKDSFVDIFALKELDSNFAQIKTMDIQIIIINTDNTIVEPNILSEKSNKVNPYDAWNLYPYELPFEMIRMNRVKQFIFKILAGSFYLSVGNGLGLGLSGSFIAKSMECSQEYVSRMIREMVRDGVIRKTSNHFMGVVAARYKLEGKYKEWGIMEKNKIKVENKSANSEENLFQRRESAKAEMVSGNINDAAWKIAKEHLFKDRLQLQEWASEIPAIQSEPKRLTVVLRAFDREQTWLEKQGQIKPVEEKEVVAA